MSEIVRRAVATRGFRCPKLVLFNVLNHCDCPSETCAGCRFGQANPESKHLPSGSIVTEYADGTVTVEVPDA